MKAAIYCRTSTADQAGGCETQLRDLLEYAAARRWETTEFVDVGVSGVKDKRPALDRLLTEVRRGRYQGVLVWKFDRWARSTRFLIETLEEFERLGVAFYSHQEALDTSSSLGRAMYVIISAIARLERDIIAERVRAGLRRAKAEGKRLGRAPLEVDPHRLNDVLRRGLSARAASRELGCSVASAWRLLKARRAGAVEADGASRAAEGVSLA